MSAEDSSTRPNVPQTIQALIPLGKRIMGDAVIQTIDGRDIHAFLEVRKKYSDWVKVQIKRGQMIENEDYILFPLEGKSGNKPTMEYFFTLEMGEHIGMMSQTAKGREVRKYFSECRRRYAEGRSSLLDKYPELKLIAETAEALAEVREAQKHLEEKTAIATDLANRAIAAQQWMTLRQYVHIHNLERQAPESVQSQFAKFLGEYCREHNIPMYTESPADRRWSEERTYHVGTINQLFPEWLKRHYGQDGLIPGIN